MNFFIPIDRKSVRKNPNAGSTVYHMYAGPPEITEVFVNGILVSKTVNQPMQTLHTLTPQPNYSFNHEDIEVRCESCEAMFPSSELVSDDVSDGDYGYSWSDRCCPKCGTWDCCELEYEKLSDPELAAIAALNR